MGFVTYNPSEAALKMAMNEAKEDIDLYLFGRELLEQDKFGDRKAQYYNSLAKDLFTGGPIQKWRQED